MSIIEGLKFIANPPEDLEIIQINPEEILNSSTYSYTKATILSDYRHGVERGVYYLNGLKEKSKNTSQGNLIS